MEKIEATREKQVANTKKYIRTLLKSAGVSDKTLGYQIELVATDIVIFRLLRSELFRSEISFKEVSREGNERTKTNPLLFDLREQSKLIQTGLDKLTMNIKSKKAKAQVEDGFSKFMEEMSKDDD